MKLLFIRHGDPDYTIDSLTEKGWKEAEFLSEKIAALDVRDFYVSPLGRAKDTASCTLKKNGRTATECKWLREFDVKIRRPDLHGEKIIPWDWLPQDWTKIENFYSFDRWWDNDILREGKMKEEYDWVTQNFDKVLAEHGYVREGHYYRAEKANEDTLVFLPFRCKLCTHQLSSQYLSAGDAAEFLCGAVIGEHHCYRGEAKRDRVLPYELFWRHFSSVCASGATGFCCQIL